MSQDYNAVAQKWLEGDFDPETKMKVLELRNNDPVGFEDAFYRNLTSRVKISGSVFPMTAATIPRCSPRSLLTS